MSARSAVLRGRAAAARLMVDTGTLSRPGAAVFDPTTGSSTVTATEIYDGPCRVRQPATIEENQRLFGETQVTASRFIVEFPHDTTDVRIDDIVELTKSDDADLLGRSFRILAVPMTTFPMYKGFPCEVVE